MPIFITTYNYISGELSELIKEFMEKDGWEVERQMISGHRHRANLLIKRPNVDKNEIKYLFNTHMDTVPPFIGARVGDDRIYGRGSNDAKGKNTFINPPKISFTGQIAAMIFTLRGVYKEHPELAEHLGLLLVVGEETDHIGMVEANKLNLKPQYLIVGEPTKLKFAHAQKGVFKVRFTITYYFSFFTQKNRKKDGTTTKTSKCEKLGILQ